MKVNYEQLLHIAQILPARYFLIESMGNNKGNAGLAGQTWEVVQGYDFYYFQNCVISIFREWAALINVII